MKNLATILFALLILPNISNAIEIPSSNIEYPVVSIFYANMFDGVCTKKTGYVISPFWLNELNKNMPHFQILWDDEGTLLLKNTVKFIGRPFVQNNFQAALSLCSFPSMSAPLLINARYSLNHFTPQPIPDYVLIGTIYHEILHNYIDSFLPKNTPLLTQYKNETKGVKSHLHLFALEKAIYLQLKWEDKLETIIKKDKSLPNPDYKRAWEIINKKENYYSFLNELKHYKNNKVLRPSIL